MLGPEARAPLPLWERGAERGRRPNRVGSPTRGPHYNTTMRHPQLVIVEHDEWIAKQLRPLAGESRWLVRQPGKGDTALSLARDGRPTVLFVQVEPGDDKADAFALIADAHRLAPDAAVVAVSDLKLPDADRVAWTAVLLDLGARYVLFPPLSRPVLEDVASGLMAAAVRRVVGGEVPPAAPRPADGTIDLADEEHHE